jgi:hypothetical protein
MIGARHFIISGVLERGGLRGVFERVVESLEAQLYKVDQRCAVHLVSCKRILAGPAPR